MENPIKEFIKPVSIVGKRWTGMNVSQIDFFKTKGTELEEIYSEQEMAVFNALFYQVQKDPLWFDVITKKYTKEIKFEELSRKLFVVKAATLRELIDLKKKNKVDITQDRLKEIKKYFKIEKITLLDLYLYGLKTKSIVAEGMWNPVLQMKSEISFLSCIKEASRYKQGREHVYHIELGGVFSMAMEEYLLSLVTKTKEHQAYGNYIKHTTGRKSYGKDAECLLEYLNVHKWKEAYTATFEELRIAFNLPKYEGERKVTLSRIVQKIERAKEKIINDITFSYEAHKKDNKITFYFQRPTLF